MLPAIDLLLLTLGLSLIYAVLGLLSLAFEYGPLRLLRRVRRSRPRVARRVRRRTPRPRRQPGAVGLPGAGRRLAAGA